MPDGVEHSAQANEPLLEINAEGEGGSSPSSMIFIVTIILLVLMTGFFVFYKYRLDSSANDKTQALNSVLDQLHSSNNKKIEDRANGVNSAIQIMTTASKTKYSFKAFMDELSKKMTNDTKLNSLAITESGLVSMDGQSNSFRAVADLALALKSSTKLENIEISGLSRGTDANTVNFSMTAQIKDWKVASTSSTETQGATNE